MSEKVLLKLEAALERVTRVAIGIGGILTLLMAVTMGYAVVMRYFFRRPEPISYELATIFMLWAFLLGVSYVELRGDHIRADLFVPYMPKAMADFLHRIISPLLAFIFVSILTWKGWTAAWYSLSIHETSMSVWAEPLGPIKVMIPICYALLLLVIVRNLIRGIAAYTSKGSSMVTPGRV